MFAVNPRSVADGLNRNLRLLSLAGEMDWWSYREKEKKRQTRLVNSSFFLSFFEFSPSKPREIIVSISGDDDDRVSSGRKQRDSELADRSRLSRLSIGGRTGYSRDLK